MSSKVRVTWRREEGPFTRGRHLQSHPITRTMRKLDVDRKVRSMCRCSGGAQNTTLGNTKIRLRAPKSNRHNQSKAHIKKHATVKIRAKVRKSRAESLFEPECVRRSFRPARPAPTHLPFTSSVTKAALYHWQKSIHVLLQGKTSPRVELCNIGPICVECIHKCSFVLPDDVKSKLVTCFAKEMRAGFRFEPGCLGQKKQSSNENVQFQNDGKLPGLEWTIINDENKNGIDEAHSKASSSEVHPEKGSNGSASCSSERRPILGLNGMPKECTDYKHILGHDFHVHCMKLSGKPEIVSEDLHLKNGLSLVPSASASVHYVNGEPGSLVSSPISFEGDSGQERAMNLHSVENVDDLDSFTCQRVRVYSKKESITCARTYLMWPFQSRKRSSDPATNGVPSTEQISTFQNKPSRNEPTDPDQLPQKGQDKSIKKDPETVCLSNTQSMLTLPKKQNSVCKGLAAWLAKRKPVKTSPLDNISGRSTPSPLTLGLTETLPNMLHASISDFNSCSGTSSPFSFTTSTPRITLPQGVSSPSGNSNASSASSFLLPQDMELSPGETDNSCSPPKLEPYFQTSMNACTNNSLLPDKSVESDILPPPLLSPLNSPQKNIIAATLVKFDNRKGSMCKMLKKKHTPEISANNNAYDYGAHQKEPIQTNNDNPKTVEPPYEEPQQSLVTDSLPDSADSIDSIENDQEQSGGDSSTDQESDTFESSNKEAEDLENPEVLDEIDAYEQDILLVDVFQGDTDLFEKLPQKSLLKLGPVRTSDTPETGRKKIVKIIPVPDSSKITQSVHPVNIDFLHLSSVDSPRRPWRPQCRSTSTLQSRTKNYFKIMDPVDARIVNTGGERMDHFASENISPQLASRLGFPIQTLNASAADIRWQKPAYCRHYFSESQDCGYKMCRFHHVPLEGDERFCMDSIVRFYKTSTCLHKAGVIFTGYYQNNKPGVFFSKPVFASLLRGLLQAGLLLDIFSVLRTSLIHNITPDHEFLLELFNSIREKGPMSLVPELVQLTIKMAGAGLSLNLDYLDCVKNSPSLQHTVSSDLPKSNPLHRPITPTEIFSLVHAVVEMEVCIKQESWKRLGEVFQAMCQSTQVSQVERVSGRIAVALLTEGKDRLTLPFAAFADTAVHNVGEDSLVKSCIGRIGVSLMLRYHKTHQWVKGQKVVEVLSAAKISYATMKGLFGNEDDASRCHLVSVAAELFLLNGCVEGALNTLRENKWFLTSSMWPCDATDPEKRTHLLLGLAEKTSQRDTLEVLGNLPGLKEPNGLIDVSKYTPFFTAHLQVCLDRQHLVLASDLVDFMFSKNLPVDQAMLRVLLQRLGKQNIWLKAREIFRTSLSKGYQPEVSAPPGRMTLTVPSELGEIELALTFEMFITLNAKSIFALPECISSTMTITLKRTQSCESEYLSAGSRLLSAASVPQPKLTVHYTTVNSSQEQVFTLDIASARRWLRHNHSWANEVWTFSP